MQRLGQGLQVKHELGLFGNKLSYFIYKEIQSEAGTFRFDVMADLLTQILYRLLVLRLPLEQIIFIIFGVVYIYPRASLCNSLVDLRLDVVFAGLGPWLSVDSLELLFESLITPVTEQALFKSSYMRLEPVKALVVIEYLVKHF